MSEELLRHYGGLVEISRGGRFEIHEDGALLAAAEDKALADKLFFKRALDVAAEQAGPGGRCRLSPAGREVYLHVEAEPEPEPPKKKPRTAFVPPTVEQVQAYCVMRGKGIIDAEAFVDHYTANGWMAGRVKMRDWKAAVRTWERKEYQTFGKESKPKKRGAALTSPAVSSLDLAGLDEEVLRHAPQIKER